MLTGDDGDVNEAWKMYTQMAATDWKLLPAAGGLEDQDEVLMDNVFAIRLAVQKLRKE